MRDDGANRPIYLDNHATTPVDPRVVAAMSHAMMNAFGNPRSTDHGFGDEARRLVEDAREQVASLVDCEPADVHFTSGASESIRVAIQHSTAQVARERGRAARILATAIEHRAVLDALDHVQQERGAQISWVGVDRRGQLDEHCLRNELAKEPDLVCAMAANNEIGTILPINSIARAAADSGGRILVDATQAAGKIEISVRNSGISYLALSAHKMYGPKGIGALIAAGERINGHDSHGTPNVPGIVGLGEACRLRRKEMLEDERRIAALRDRLQAALLASEPSLVVNGDAERRLSGNLHLSVPGVPSDAVIANLRDRVALSTGAACSSGAETPSHVLLAIGLHEGLQDGALRIGLGKFTTEHEVDAAARALIETIRRVRSAID